MERQELIYKLEGVDYEEGISVYDLMPFLLSFGDLVRETVKELGYGDEVSVKVKPFKQGSFITEFVLSCSDSLFSLLSSEEAGALATALTVLGFKGVPEAVKNVPEVVRKIKGRISNYEKCEDGTFDYQAPDGEVVNVDAATHKVIQSKKVAENLRKISVGPFALEDKSVTRVVISQTNEKDTETVSFSKEDIQSFNRYKDEASGVVSDDIDSNEVVQHGIWLNPLSGSYSGKDRGYSFKQSESVVYKNVKIEDAELIAKLENSTIRFFEKDLLQVDLKIRQSVSKSGNITEHYSITKLLKYIPYKPPIQTSIEDFQ